MRAAVLLLAAAALWAAPARAQVVREVGHPTAVQAEELPCSPAESAVSYTIRWQPQGTEDLSISGWVLVRQAAGNAPEAFTLTPTPAVADGAGVLSASLGGFTTNDRWRITLFAVNDGGWSEPSNVLEIPASTRRCGPPVPPKLWEVNAAPRLPEPPAEKRALEKPPEKKRSVGRRIIDILPGVP